MARWAEAACFGLLRLRGPEHALGVGDAEWVSARRLIQAMRDIPQLTALPSPFVSPIEGSGLQIEWDLHGRHLEIEFLDARHLGVLWAEGEEIRTAEFLVTHVERVVGLLKWLLRGEADANRVE